MAYEIPTLSLVKDNIVRIHHPASLGPSTYLTAAVSATGTALTVANNAGFTNGDLLLYEGYGSENAEIKSINGAVTAGTSITSSAVTFAHAIDCSIERVLWNQVQIAGASTATGTKTAIETVNLTVDHDYTDYVVTGTTYAYYFVRYYNSSTAAYSSYSDAVAYTDFPPNTVGFVRRAAFENVDQDFSGKFTAQWVYDSLYQCEQDILSMKPHFSCVVEMDYDLGDLAEGDRRMALPSDIADKQTNKSILGLRISGRDNLEYVDNADFQELMYDVHNTTLATTANIGDTTLTLTDSNDFDDSGSVTISGTDYAYTGNNRTTNTLSGLTALSAGITSGAEIWQGIEEGEPRRYTVMDGYIYWDLPPDDDWEDMNVYIDYFKGAQRYNSDGDELLLNEPGLYIYWLEKEIKRKKSGGELTLGDVSGREYDKRKALFVAQDKNVYGLRFIPSVPLVRTRKPFQFWR